MESFKASSPLPGPPFLLAFSSKVAPKPMVINDGHAAAVSSAEGGRVSVRWTTLQRRLRERGGLTGVTSGSQSPAPDELVVDHLTDDSRAVEPGGAFVAIRGTEADGHSFIDNAIENGARLVVCEEVPGAVRERFPAVVFATVSDTRVALAELAGALHGDPADALRLVGVTGTNGKTTVAFLVQHLLEELGETAGLLSTVEVRTGAETTTSDLTTPGPVELQQTLRRMVDQGCTACAMEVSSHALDQDRVHGLDFEVAVFTNLTADHLNYHGTPRAYRQAKKKLFDGLSSDAYALYNADDDAGARMVADSEATPVSFGFGPSADIRPEILESRIEGLRLAFDGRERTFRLAGRFNAYNLAAAYGAGRVLEYDSDSVLDVLAEAPPVPGRFEQLTVPNGPTVVVDYAHTPDALETVLKAVHETAPTDATLWCVFGCGGDRDPSKRGTMGAIAERHADRVIVTSDNPRTEEPEAIMEDIRRGVTRPEDVDWIVDREAAIQAAAEQARRGDVVLIAGKGHETYQTIGTEKRPFDDREMVRTYFD